MAIAEPAIFDERPPARPKKSATAGVLIVFFGSIMFVGGAWALYTAGTELVLKTYRQWDQMRRADAIDAERLRQYHENQKQQSIHAS